MVPIKISEDTILISARVRQALAIGRCRASVRPDRASSAAMKASEPSGRSVRSPRRFIQRGLARRIKAAEHSRRLISVFWPKRICQVPMAICCPSHTTHQSPGAQAQ